jgi:hypothetical protein
MASDGDAISAALVDAFCMVCVAAFPVRLLPMPCPLMQSRCRG